MLLPLFLLSFRQFHLNKYWFIYGQKDEHAGDWLQLLWTTQTFEKKHVEHRTMSVLYGMNQDFEEKIIIFAKSSAFWSQVDKENEQQ